MGDTFGLLTAVFYDCPSPVPIAHNHFKSAVLSTVLLALCEQAQRHIHFCTTRRTILLCCNLHDSDALCELSTKH